MTGWKDGSEPLTLDHLPPSKYHDHVFVRRYRVRVGDGEIEVELYVCTKRDRRGDGTTKHPFWIVQAHPLIDDDGGGYGDEVYYDFRDFDDLDEAMLDMHNSHQACRVVVLAEEET